MRKVTASAVILTAVAGCSQSSSIPSTQWSFEVPSESSLTPVKAEGNTGDITSAISDLSTDATSSAITPAVTDVMGSPTSHSVRPDPIAQVRSYLQANGSPSALANRTPYSSQVFLSSVPTTTPQTITPSYEQAPVGTDFLAPSQAEPSLQIPQLLAVSAAPSDLSSSLYSGSEPQAESTRTANLEDGLPRLQPAPIQNFTAPETVDMAQSVAIAQATEDVSIGTAILRNLQSDSATNAATISTDVNDVEPAAERPANQPSVSGLIATMPPREPSALVASQQTAAQAYQPVRLNISEASLTTEQGTEAVLKTDPATPNSATPTLATPDLARESSTVESPTVEVDLHSNRSTSPLLESLQAGALSQPVPLSTLYVPIAEPTTHNLSGSLIREAMTGSGDEASTADFIEMLASRGIFSAVLKSAAMNHELDEAVPSAAVGIVVSISPGPVASESTSQNSVMILSDKASDKRRQRITWL
ncbi:MAG: hypothetical protein WA885_19790 [Phormidesmis sp.]